MAGRARFGNRHDHFAPDSMPVLSRGKHRKPREGACLMEYVAFLSGGPFSDAPACTDKTLAVIARAVNDYSSDAQRQRLAILASDLTVCGPLELANRHDLARRCLLTAIPYSVEDRRRVLVVALLGLERAVAGRTKGYDSEFVGLDAEFALLGSDSAVRQAAERLEQLPVSVEQHRDRGLAATIELAVATIAEEAYNADDVLYDLLVSCLDDHRRASGRSDARPSAAPSQDLDGVSALRKLREGGRQRSGRDRLGVRSGQPDGAD
jgi:hypothetical protein